MLSGTALDSTLSTELLDTWGTTEAVADMAYS